MCCNSPIVYGKQLFRKNVPIYVQLSTSFPEYVGKLHRHDFIEIVYIVSGKCTHIENNSSIAAKKGDLFIINYGVPHSNVALDSEEPFIAYDCAFSMNFLDEYLRPDDDFLNIKSSFLMSGMFSDDESGVSMPLNVIGSHFFEFEQILKKMLEEYQNERKGYSDLLRAYLTELLIKIFRQMDALSSDSRKNKQEYYINLAIQYIENHYHKKLTLSDIAYRSFLSKGYFSQLFKETTGLSFSNYVQQVRIKKSCELLENTDKSIMDISDETGFSDIKFFYTIFKRVLKMTPKEYRDSKRRNAKATEIISAEE